MRVIPSCPRASVEGRSAAWGRLLFELQYTMMHGLVSASSSWPAPCRRWLLAPERLQETHAQDYAKGLSREQVHQVKAFAVQCEGPWPASLPCSRAPAELLRTHAACAADIEDLAKSSQNYVRRRCGPPQILPAPGALSTGVAQGCLALGCRCCTSVCCAR